MDELLYHIFVFEQNNGRGSISFDRIKRLISNNIVEYENVKQNYNYLFNLLKLGIIDKVENNKYALSNSVLIIDTKSNITIGVNIPKNVLDVNSNLIKKQYLGLTIFYGININEVKYEIYKMYFDFDKIVSLLNPIASIVKQWEETKINEVGQINRIEKYNPINCKWENSLEIRKNNCVFRIYLFNNNFYKYLFLFRNKYYLIEPYEYEKLNTLKLIDNNKSLFIYNRSTKVLKLKSYYTYPVYLYKILFLNHIMNTGDFSLNNQFIIDQRQFSKITKTLNLKYKFE
jgi:hypothetical protein